MSGNKKEIWFVYDGECPLCKKAALALRIKEEYGYLNLLNARENQHHHLLKEINKRNLDLDEGMIICDGDQFLHGKDALRFMARFGESKGWFNLSNKLLYWSDSVAKIIYPWLRGLRNLLLRFKKIDRIDNLSLKDEPIFKSVFGDSWDDLPLIIKKHYANHPYTDEVNTAEGFLDVACKPPLSYLSVLMRLMGQIPARNQNKVPVTVYFQSDKDTRSLHYNRIFLFAGEKPYLFHSRLLPLHDNHVIEIMPFGLAWKARFFWDDEKVRLEHDGYSLNFLGHFIPIPLTWVLGRGYAEERPIDGNTFSMITHITHPWFGKLYEYKGTFIMQ